MKPDTYEDDFVVIDAALDFSIFPPGISHGLTVLSPDDHDRLSIDGFDDFPEIDYNEFRDHI